MSLQNPSYRQKIILLVLVGVVLRGMALFNWNFGFDQVQILEASKQIVAGHLTLIGPRTGPAEMFTGPLIYYINAIFYFFTHSYYSLVLTSLAIAAITGVTLFFLVRKYIGKSEALWAVTLWGGSQFLIALDQTTWNPNLSLLSASLFFFPISHLLQAKSVTKFDLFSIFFGSFLAYQAHFSGFLLLPLAAIFLFAKQKKVGIFATASTVSGFAVSLLPLVLFDLRHNWLNVRGLLTLISNLFQKDEVSVQLHVIKQIWRSFYTAIESMGRASFENSNLPVTLLFGLGILMVAIYIVLARKNRLTKWLLPLLWMLITILSFSMYPGDTPPYYFLIIMPAVFVVLLALLGFLPSLVRRTVLALFLLLALANQISTILPHNPFSITTALAVHSYIISHSGSGKIQNLTYHVPEGNTFGFKYIFQNDLDSESDADSWLVSYPDELAYGDEHFSGIYIAKQPTISANEHQYETNRVRFVTTDQVALYENQYYQGDAERELLVRSNESFVARIEEYSFRQASLKFPEILLARNTGWQSLSPTSFTAWYEPSDSVYVLTMDTKQELFTPDLINIY